MTGTSNSRPRAEKRLEKEAWDEFTRNRWVEAAAKFDQVLLSNHASEGALQGKIACLRCQRNFHDARTLLASALQIHSDSVGILCERAWLDLAELKYDEAITAFDAVLALEQSDESLFRWKIDLLLKRQRLDDAAEAIKDAEARFPHSRELAVEGAWLLFYKTHFTDAGDAFAEVLKLDRANQAALQGLIASLRMQGRYEEAERQARRAVVGNSPGLMSEIGWLQFSQEHFEEAAEAFAKVIVLTPRDAYAHVNLAWALQRQGTPVALARAGAACEAALEIEAKLPEARGCLGVIAFAQGQVLEAERQFRKSIECDAAAGYYADLAALYIEMARYEDAECTLKAGLTERTGDAGLHVQRGHLYLQTDLCNEAVAAFRQAVAIDPARTDAVRGLAIALLERGRTGEAEGVVRTALRQLDRSKRWQLHLMLCQVLTRQADDSDDTRLYQDALGEVRKALALRPEHPDPYFHSGIVRFKLGDYGNSLVAFKRCQKLGKDRVDAEVQAIRVQAIIKQERTGLRASKLASGLLGTVVLLQLITIWGLRWRYRNEIVTATMITVLVPICLGLGVVSMMLPWLSKLKVTGIEAELSEVKPKDALTLGPKGEVGFGDAARTSRL